MLKKWLAGILLIMLAGYTGWNLYQTYSKKEVGIQEGQQAPDFSLKTLSGEKSSLQDAKGKKVLLNFWATWCKPCRQEMPAMEKLQKEYADKLAVVAVNFTSAEKSEKQVRAFADTYDLTFPILIDKKGINADYNVMSYPTTYILDEKGVIQDIHVGTMTKKKWNENWILIRFSFFMLRYAYKFSELEKIKEYAEVRSVKKMRKRSFHELVMENKKELMTNTEYLNQLEEKLEQRFKQK